MQHELNPSPADMVSGCEYQKEVGDLVQLGPNRGTTFKIVAIDGDEAWIRSTIGYAGSHIVALDRLRWIPQPELVLAA